MSTSRAEDYASRALATDVRVDDDALHVVLSDGRELSVPLAWFPRLVSATAQQRASWKLIGDGHGIRWDDLDEDLSIAGLIRGTRPL